MCLCVCVVCVCVCGVCQFECVVCVVMFVCVWVLMCVCVSLRVDTVYVSGYSMCLCVSEEPLILR